MFWDRIKYNIKTTTKRHINPKLFRQNNFHCYIVQLISSIVYRNHISASVPVSASLTILRLFCKESTIRRAYITNQMHLRIQNRICILQRQDIPLPERTDRCALHIERYLLVIYLLVDNRLRHGCPHSALLNTSLLSSTNLTYTLYTSPTDHENTFQ